MHVSNSRVFNNNNKKIARNLRTNLNILTEWKASERKKVFSHCRVHIRYLVFLLPVPEEYMLPFSREIVLRQGT